MKRTFLVISIIAGLMLGFTACQKNEEAATKKQNISEADLQTAQKITSFIEKMENPITLKSGGGSETMDLEDARWNLEAALNYQFCNVPEDISDIQIDSLEVVLPVNGNLCAVEDVATLYQQLCVTVAEQTGIEDFELMAVGISLKDQNNNEVIFQVYFFQDWGAYLVNSFRPWEYFPGCQRNKSNNPVYYCDGSRAGQPAGTDVFEEMMRRANAFLPILGHPGGTVYFTDIEYLRLESFRKENPNWDGEDIFLRFTIFQVNFPVESPHPINICIPPYALNFYLNNIKHVLLNDATIEGKHLIGLTYMTYTQCEGYPDYSEFWRGEISFGIPNVKPMDQ